MYIIEQVLELNRIKKMIKIVSPMSIISAMLLVCILTLHPAAHGEEIPKEPKLAAVYYKLKGDKLLKNKKSEEAITAYKQATRLDPMNFAYWVDLGNLLRKLRRYPLAATAFLSAVKRNTSYKYGYYNIAYSQRKSGKFDKAIEYYRKYLKLNPTDPDAHYGLAASYEKAQMHHDAIKSYQAYAKQENRLSEKKWVEKALQKINLIKISLSVKEMKDRLQIRDKEENIKKQLLLQKAGTLKRKVEDALKRKAYTEASKTCLKWIALDFSAPLPYLQLAKIAALQGKDHEAYRRYKEYLLLETRPAEMLNRNQASQALKKLETKLRRQEQIRISAEQKKKAALKSMLAALGKELTLKKVRLSNTRFKTEKELKSLNTKILAAKNSLGKFSSSISHMNAQLSSQLTVRKRKYQEALAKLAKTRNKLEKNRREKAKKAALLLMKLKTLEANRIKLAQLTEKARVEANKKAKAQANRLAAAKKRAAESALRLAAAREKAEQESRRQAEAATSVASTLKRLARARKSAEERAKQLAFMRKQNKAQLRTKAQMEAQLAKARKKAELEARLLADALHKKAARKAKIAASENARKLAELKRQAAVAESILEARKLAREKARKLAAEAARKLAAEAARKLAAEAARKLASETARKLAAEAARKLASETARKLASDRARRLAAERERRHAADLARKLAAEKAHKLTKEKNGTRRTLENSTNAAPVKKTCQSQKVIAKLKKGNNYAKRKIFGLALIMYLDAIRIDSNCPEAHYRVGRIYYKTMQKSRAIKHLKKALNLEPKLTEAKNFLKRIKQR